MKEFIRIASGQGYWGDWLEAPLLLAGIITKKSRVSANNGHLKICRGMACRAR